MPFDPYDFTLSMALPEKLINFNGSEGPKPWIVSSVTQGSRIFDEHAWEFVDVGLDSLGKLKGKLKFTPAKDATLTVSATKPRTLSVLVMCGGIENALTVRVTV